ncbi:MAG: peptidylprolyl isomerase [Microvirga sp.]|jgi:peptidyl-prolyl cis-trans isomerase C|uniref:Parvulin-like PPIase n=1 Tax=Microvirga tunisiensis TaxID=2108360 RepID=A0A5N7MMH6_9HYPH|nr:peptidylprolyl isomerase [Microvirga tunisiensis]MPR09882.1 peptidylprolyl isomerase [Microvirga tunisiensis]MPR28093.1 peptidylprolyl isomerase [Microvirga tunisiensis]
MSRSLTFRKSLLTLSVALPIMAGAALAQTPPAPATSPAAVPAVDPAKVIARVNGVDITEGDLALAAEDPALQMPNVPEAQKRDLLTGYMIDLKLGAKAAEAAKVGSGAEFTRKLAYNRDKTLLDEYLDQEAKKAVTPEAARKLYDETVKSVPTEQEVRARHILVENEDEAKKIATRVKGGEDFAKVAGEVSKDPGSKTDGGDLGFFTKDRMVEPFAETAFKLEPGQISDPVKSQFGWHVIKVEEKRAKPAPTFDETKDQVETYLARKAQQDLIMGLRKNAKIERLDDKGNLVEQKQQ